MQPSLLLVILFVSFSEIHLARSSSDTSEEKTVEDYLNKCKDLKPEYSHDEPKEEKNLECPQYRDNACCKPGATEPFKSAEKWTDFVDYTHCAVQTGKTKLNQTCHDRFFDELCFFVCSPDTGPWTIKASAGTVVDGTYKLPICQSVCDEWYDACKEEYTCADNWYTGFNSTGPGTPRCLDNAECKTYQETWGGATEFCQGVWYNSFEVVPDSKPCMKFAEGQTSGNADVAEYYAKKLVGSASSPWLASSYLAITVLVSLSTI